MKIYVRTMNDAAGVLVGSVPFPDSKTFDSIATAMASTYVNGETASGASWQTVYGDGECYCEIILEE